MSNFEDRFNAYIKANPRQSLHMVLFAVCLVWMTPVCVLGLVLYILLSKIARVQWWLSLMAGFCMALIIVMTDLKYSARDINFAEFMKEGFTWNYGFWKLMITCSGSCAIKFLLKYMMLYVAGFPLLLAGLLSAVDLIQDNPHRRIIDALQKR